MKMFTKNDQGFICANCKKEVQPLKHSSRDHCTHCLCSIHIDINPGDRANNCLGLLVPYDLEYSQNKGYVIKYKCEKCGQLHNNKASTDDSITQITKVANKTYKK